MTLNRFAVCWVVRCWNELSAVMAERNLRWIPSTAVSTMAPARVMVVLSVTLGVLQTIALVRLITVALIGSPKSAFSD